MNPTDILLSIAIVGIYTTIYVYLKSKYDDNKIIILILAIIFVIIFGFAIQASYKTWFTIIFFTTLSVLLLTFFPNNSVKIISVFLFTLIILGNLLTNFVNVVFTNIYGVGPKKADELVKKHNITSIEELRKKQDEVLNNIQRIGLKYYEDILERIPRNEIEKYDCKRHFEVFNTFGVIPKNCFSCYKVQIQPNNVLELIKVYFYFVYI